MTRMHIDLSSPFTLIWLARSPSTSCSQLFWRSHGDQEHHHKFYPELGQHSGQAGARGVFVLFSALLCVLLDTFGSRRRQHSHGFFRFFVWAVYTLFSVLVPYTIGLLQDDPFRDQTFVMWGVILLLIQVSAPDSISVYSVHHIEQRKRVLVQHVLQIILVLWLILNCKGRNRSYTATIWIIFIQSIIMAYRNAGTLSNAGKKGGLVKQSKVVADYMIELDHVQRDQDNPKTMQGYRYILFGEEEVASLLPTSPEYRVVLEGENIRRCRTIDDMWRWIDTRSGQTMEVKDILKDVTLSFTLYKLLKRRLCKYRISEAGHPKTLHFVLDGLLSDKDKYVRAFRVVEMELAFLYDFLYTRFDMKTMNYKFWALLFFSINVTVWNCISGAFSRHYHRSNLEQRIHKIDVTHWVTIVLLIIVLPMSSLVSNSFHTRWILLVYLRGEKTHLLSTLIDHVELEAKKSWQRALGQYSLLLNFDYCPWNLLPRLSLGLVDAKREGQKAGKKIVLTDKVIMRVLSGFKENEGKLRDGQSALERNGLLQRFSRACTLPTATDIHKILIWHIGTTIAMHSPQYPRTDDYHVAETLSNYCAYLVAFVPDMLPGHGYDNQRIFDAVVKEAQKYLAGCDTVGSRCEELMTTVLPSNSILELGARLGIELRGVVEERRWKVLADFWADFILFLAPSINYDIHTEKLATGGEFMTHLWALLTHAGILERPSDADGVGGNPAHDSPV